MTLLQGVALAFLYGVCAIVASAVWLIPATERAIDRLIQRMTGPARNAICVREFIGFAMMNSIFVYGVLAVLFTHDVRFYTVGALLVAGIVAATLIRTVLSRILASRR